MICYLVRHGQDDNTVRGGWSMSPLTENGIRQAEHLAEVIASDKAAYDIRRIFSSDLPRAVQTARPTAAALGLEIEERPEFRETNNGELAGMKNVIALRRFPGMFWNTLDWDQHYPGGESPHEFYDRISAAWEKLKAEVSGSDGNIMLVTHAGVINVIMCITSGRPFSNKQRSPAIDHTKIIKVEI